MTLGSVLGHSVAVRKKVAARKTVAALAVLSCLGLALTSTPAAAVEPGAIAGTVTDVDGDPMAHLLVGAFGDHDPPIVSTVLTDVDGSYVIPDLEPGDFGVIVSMPDDTFWCYDGHTDCVSGSPFDPVTVTDGGVTTGVDFQWDQDDDRPAFIIGTLTDSDGDPLPLAMATLYDEAGDEVRKTASSTDGDYSFFSLPAGTYHVLFDGLRPSSQECFDDLPWTTGCTAGTDIVLQPGASELGVDAQLEVDGPIFDDVPTDISRLFVLDILWLVEQGIADGFPDGGFHPSAPVSRQAMAAFLYRLEGNPAGPNPPCGAPPFPDVADTPFCGAIQWLASEEILQGFADGLFHPTAPVTRQAMAAFLYRFFLLHGTDLACGEPPFPDVPITLPFCGPIEWMADEGIAFGYADGLFHPTAPVTRQAMAAFLHRFDGLGS